MPRALVNLTEEKGLRLDNTPDGPDKNSDEESSTSEDRASSHVANYTDRGATCRRLAPGPEGVAS